MRLQRFLKANKIYKTKLPLPNGEYGLYSLGFFTDPRHTNSPSHFFAKEIAKNYLEVNSMIFNTLRSDAFEHTESKIRYVEITVRVPRYVLENAIQEF